MKTVKHFMRCETAEQSRDAGRVPGRRTAKTKPTVWQASKPSMNVGGEKSGMQQRSWTYSRSLDSEPRLKDRAGIVRR